MKAMFSSLIKNAGLAVMGLLLLAGGFFLGAGAGYQEGIKSREVSALANKETDSPQKVDFSPFWRVWNIMDDKFVPTSTSTAPEIQERVWGAIGGMVDAFGDPYTTFLPPEDAKFFEEEISGEFQGVGMEVGIRGGVLTVVAPLKGTPAFEAGIQSEDKIVEIDDEVTGNMTLEQAVKKIRGPKGTEVTLTVIRKGRNEPLKISIVRDVIDIPTIETEVKTAAAGGSQSGTGLREDGVFIIRLFNFSRPSSNLFRNALRNFVLSGSKDLVIDLRGNPGGFLDAAVDTASWFIPRGKVIVTEDYGNKEVDSVHRSRGYGFFGDDIEVAVLVNGGSASASEIFAGALQDHDKAVIVGTKTFGKGSVQELVPVENNTSLKVTVARWLTPDGKSISENGLTPDEVVEMTPEDAEAGRDPQLDMAIDILTGE